MAKKDLMKYGMLGGVAALAVPTLLKFISNIVSMVPGLSVDLQSVSVTTSGLGGVVNTGLGTYAQKLFSTLPINISGMEYVYTFIGGALFVMLGKYIVDWLKLSFGSSKQAKLATIFVVAGIVSGWVLSMSISIPAFTAIIVSALNAFVLSYIVVWADDLFKLKLVP